MRRHKEALDLEYTKTEGPMLHEKSTLNELEPKNQEAHDDPFRKDRTYTLHDNAELNKS